jgi:ATP-dependent HslUV protease ATP-binding subunit HslU
MARHAHLQQQPQQPPQHQPMGPASLPAASAAAAPRRRRSNAAARRRAPTAAAAASAASADPSWGGDKAPDTSAVPADLPPAPEGLDQPYPRRHERDPRRLLGVDPDASFEEIQDARNFLSERHRGHAPSREAIELAFDALLQAHLADRARRGFAPPAAPGRRGAAAPRRAPPAGLAAVAARFRALWDPTVTARTVVNEGSVFAALAVWALFAGEQSFPTVAAVAYCIYQFKAKRVKRDPEGPFFVNSPMAGAVLSSACCLAVAVGAGTVLAPALQVLVQSAQEQQARTFVAIATLGALGIALK